MADNVTVDTITGSPVVKTDDDGSAHWPYVKLAFGADNTQTIVGSISSNPLPVALSATDNAVLDTIDAVLDTIKVDTEAIETAVEAINAKLVTGTDIGDVDVLSVAGTVTVDGSGVTQPVSGTVTANLSATDNAVLDSIDTATTALLADTAILTAAQSRAVISAAGSGDNTLLAAQGAGNKIRVTSMFYLANGTVTVRLEDGAAGTALTGQMDHIAYTGLVLPFNPNGWFEGTANTLLNMELSAAIEVAGAFTYTVVT